MHPTRLLAYLWLTTLLCLAHPAISFAQTAPEATSETSTAPATPAPAPVTTPSITLTELDGVQAKLNAANGLGEDDIKRLQDQITRSRDLLQNAEAQDAERATFDAAFETAPRRVEELKTEISALRELPPPETISVDRMDNTMLRDAEDSLAAAETELARLRAESDTVNNRLVNFLNRPTSIESDITAAQSALTSIGTELNRIEGVDSSIAIEVRRDLLLSQRRFRRAEIAKLESERRSRLRRQELSSLERDLLALQIDRTMLRMAALQSLTGQRRLNEARTLAVRNQEIANTAPTHPLIVQAIAENTRLIDQFEDLALSEADLPQRRADTQQSYDTVSENLIIAEQLTNLGDLDRRAGETLRRLRANVPIIPAIRAQCADTRSAIIEAGQDSLLAGEELRRIPLRSIDADALITEARRDNPDIADLSPDQLTTLNSLYDIRRETLRKIAEASLARREDASSLLTLQTDLVTISTELQTTLDQNLLGLPSAEPIFSAGFPGKVVRGTLKVLQPARAGAVLKSLTREVLRPFPALVSAVGLIIALSLFMMRSTFRRNITESARVVGRVRQDSYFVTPKVILESVLVALPLPLVIGISSWLVSRGDDSNAFVLAAGDALAYLALFMLFFLTLRSWSSKDGVFHRHVRIPEDLRRGIQIETRWFIPVFGTAIALFILSQDSRDTDIYEGFSLLAFLVAAVSLGMLSYRLLWGRRAAFTKTLDPDGTIYRYRKPLIALAVGIPFVAAGMAAFGLFSTADDLLYRIFMTGWLIILTFIVYGTLSRTLNITHRRLSLKQAMEKREAGIEARRREAKAEQNRDGDMDAEAEAPPPVDYEQIDLEQTSRQTSQLIATAVIIGFFVLVYLIWRDLLPALSALDSVQLYENGERMDSDTGVPVINYITLWDLMQALFTIGVTVVAAKNLPGFLEIFVLNRSKMDQGVRYAIVTILGYVIVAFGIFTALNQLGVQWGQLGFIVAALGVGIGFGLQEIIANFISGIIILFERPVRVGDYVTVGDQSGTVSRIKIRATTLTDLDNKEILIPNKEFITGRVTNWTLSNSVLRLIIPVGIAYGSDTKRAQKIMLDVLQGESKILDKPGPQVMFVNFGDSSLDFELRVFIRSFEDRFPVINSIHTSINLALEEAGIGIPFPQRDLHLVSADARLTLDQALSEQPPKSSKAKPKKA